MLVITSSRLRGTLACMCAIALAGCGGGDGGADLTTQSVSQTTAGSGQVPAGKGRLVLSRPGGILYAGSAATVKVNGSKVADLYGGNSLPVDVAPGKVTITVDAWNYPGSWTEQLSVAAGSTYDIEVAPREDSVGTAVVFGAIGGAIEAQNNPKSGLFQWKVTKQSAAQVAAAPAATAKPAKGAPASAKASAKATAPNVQ
jgi:hypothetical protein